MLACAAPAVLPARLCIIALRAEPVVERLSPLADSEVGAAVRGWKDAARGFKARQGS